MNAADDKRKTEKRNGLLTSHHSSFSSLSEKIDCIASLKLSEVDVSGYDVIGIDEAQFFEDVDTVVRNWVLKDHKTVFVASLDGDFRANTFGKVHNLICICTSVEKLLSVCTYCTKQAHPYPHVSMIPAPFTLRFKTAPHVDGSKAIGGKEDYTAVCMKCYQEKYFEEPIVPVGVSLISSGGLTGASI